MNVFENTNRSPEQYADAALIAHEASEAMLSRLQWMTIKPKVILDVGCRTGKNSAMLRAQYPEAQVLALDQIWPMILHTSRTTGLSACVCADGDTLPLRDHSVDLIFANFFLPWQSDIHRMLKEWRRVLSPNGLLMLTALGLDTLQECRAFIAEEDHPRLIDMHDIGDAFVQNGLAEPVLDVERYTVTYHDSNRLIDDLLDSELWFPLHPTQETVDAMLSHWPVTEGVRSLTYEVIYAHAFAPPIAESYSPSKEGVTKIPLAHLKWVLHHGV